MGTENKDPFESLPSIKKGNIQESHSSQMAKDPFASLPSLPDKEQAAIANQLENGEMSSGEALLHGAEQGVTAGFFDELQGGMEGAGTALGLKGLGGPVRDISLQKPNLSWEDIKKAYEERRDSERVKVKKAQDEHGGMFLAGNIGGSMLLPGAGSVKGAATLGAATGLGTSEASDAKGMLLDTGVGAATGYLAGKAGEKLGKMLTPEATQARASARAVKALGEKPLPENLPIGKAVLDEGLLPMTGGSKATLKGITDRMTELEKGTVQPTLDAVSQNTGLQQAVASRAKPIEDIVSDVAQAAKNNVEQSSVAQAGKDAIDRAAEYWSKELQAAGGDPKKLNNLRKLIDSEAKSAGAFGSNPDLRPKADFLAKLRDAVNDELRGIASDVSTGAGQQLETAMGRQSALYGAKDAAEKLVEKDIVHPPGSIMDIIKNPITNPRALGVGLATAASNPMTKIGMGGVIAAEKLTKNPIGRLGNIASARVQNQMAKGLDTTVGRMVSPAVQAFTTKSLSSSGVQSGIQSLYSASDEKLKQVAEHFSQQKGTADLANSLNTAINNNDTEAKNRMIFAMMQRPDIREQLRDLDGLSLQEEDTNQTLPGDPNG